MSESTPTGGSHLPPTPPGNENAPLGGEADHMVNPRTPPTDPVLVLLLNLFIAGGLGYIIMGQKTKGVVAIVLWFIVAVPTCGAASALIMIAAAIDGYLQALQLSAGHPIGQWTFFNDHRG